MAKISNGFKFVGKLESMKEGLRDISSKTNSKWHGKELSLKVKTETGTQLVRLFGGITEGSPIVTFSKDKDDKGKSVKLEIPYAKRNEKEVIDSVANFKKIKILGEEFITELDAIDYIDKNMIDIEGMDVVVVGKVEFDVYKGKIYSKYYLTGIYEAKEDQKEGFNGSLALFVDSNTIAEDYKKGKSINYKLIEKDRKIPLTVYIEQYNKDKATRDEKPNLYIPITVYVSLSDKFDFDNEKHLKSLKFKLETLLVNKGIHEIGWEVRFFKGAEQTEVTMDDLTKFEKAQIENNVKTFEEIAKGKQAYGEFTEEIQLIKFHKNYEDGLVEAPITEDDLEDISFTEGDDNNTSDPVVEEIDDDEDLF